MCVAHAIEFWTAFLAFAKETRPEALALMVPIPVKRSRTRKVNAEAGTEELKEAGLTEAAQSN